MLYASYVNLWDGNRPSARPSVRQLFFSVFHLLIFFFPRVPSGFHHVQAGVHRGLPEESAFSSGSRGQKISLLNSVAKDVFFFSAPNSNED